MDVTKEQIARGVAKFIHEEVIPGVGDSATQILLGITASAIDTNPRLMDKLLDNGIFSMVARVGNSYNLSTLQNAATSAIDKYGKLTFTIPGIKFISPDDKILQFGSDDVKRLVALIEGRQ